MAVERPHTSDQRPIRILHVLGMMDRCGVETWLLHLLRSIDRTRFQMDFVVENPGVYDEEVRALGSRVIRCPHPAAPWRFRPTFMRALREYGPYDVLHIHERIFSYVLPWAAWAGVPVRIAHSHNDDLRIGGLKGAAQERYRAAMDWFVNRYATIGLACSEQAATDRFGRSWRDDPRFRLLYCGIDLAPFHAPVDRLALRASLGIPPDAFVVGHVGKFAYQKNHELLVRVVAEMVKREPKTWALLVGKGELQTAVETQVAGAGLAERVTFTGSRPDVPRLLRAMDAFLFPSRFEGLGLALVEAQAAGLPCVIAAVIPPEADVVPGLVRRVPLDAPLATWAAAVTATRECDTTPAEALRCVAASPFTIEASRTALEELYETETRRVGTPTAAAAHLATRGRFAAGGG